MSCLGVPAGGRKVLLPTQRSGAPFLPGHRGWGGLSAKGTPGLPVERKEWEGWQKVAPWACLPPRTLGLPSSSASLTFTVTFSRGSGGTSGWQEPLPGACQHSVASAASEHGATSRQPRGGSSCSRATRQRLRWARVSAGRGRGHCAPRTRQSAPIPPWPLRVLSPFLNGQMLVLTESGSRGHTWKGNRAPRLGHPNQPSRDTCRPTAIHLADFSQTLVWSSFARP